MDPGQESLVEQFIKVTEVDRDRAKFFLESSSWDLEVFIYIFIYTVQALKYYMDNILFFFK